MLVRKNYFSFLKDLFSFQRCRGIFRKQDPLSLLHICEHFEFLSPSRKYNRELKNFIFIDKPILAHDLLVSAFWGRNKTENMSEREKKKGGGIRNEW